MKAVRNIIDKLIVFLAICAGLVTFVMMVMSTTDVVIRIIASRGISGVYEFTQYYFMPLSVMLAAPMAYKAVLLPKVDDIVNMLPLGLQKACAVLRLITDVLIYALFTYCSFFATRRAFSEKASFTVGTKVFTTAPVYIAIVAGFILILLYVIFNFKMPTAEKEEKVVTEEWE